VEGQKESIEKSIERLREGGTVVPIAILSYDLEQDRFKVCILDDVNPQEASALLSKLHLEILSS